MTIYNQLKEIKESRLAKRRRENQSSPKTPVGMNYGKDY